MATSINKILSFINGEECFVKRLDSNRGNVIGFRVTYGSDWNNIGAAHGLLFPSEKAIAKDYLRGLRAGEGTIPPNERADGIKMLEEWLQERP